MFMLGEMVEEESCVCPRFARATLACFECDIFFSLYMGSRDISLVPHFCANDILQPCRTPIAGHIFCLVLSKIH